MSELPQKLTCRHFDTDGYVRIDADCWSSARPDYPIRVTPEYSSSETKGIYCPPESVARCADFAAELCRRWNEWAALREACEAGKRYADALAAAWQEDGAIRKTEAGVTTVQGDVIDLDALFEDWRVKSGYAIPDDLVISKAGAEAARAALNQQEQPK